VIYVGDRIHGHAHGALGRDWHQCARVEYRGTDWCVVRAPNGDVALARESDFPTLAENRDRGVQESCSNGMSDGCQPTEW
jgi:hypothetical protein